MSDNRTEPEKYTLDEMMERLKRQSSSENAEGELVTRADGSQAVRVRKRKRRTNQAVNKETKRNHRIQVLQITGFILVIALLGLIAGVGILYVNSSSYRTSLTEKAEAASGAVVEIKQFRMNPSTANSNQVTMEWPAGNALKSLNLRNVTAKVAPASFLGKVFAGDEITALKGELIINAPTAGEPARHSNLLGNLPVKFLRYSVPSVDVYFGGEKRSANMLQDSEISLFPSSVVGHAEIRLLGGLLKKEEWPLLELDRSYIKIEQSNLEVKSLRFQIPPSKNQPRTDRGFIDFTGTIQALETDRPHILKAEVEAFSLPYLLGANLGRFFVGHVDSLEVVDSNFLTITPNSEEPAVLNLMLSNALDSRIDLSNFPFLGELALALGEHWYESPTLDDEVSLHVQRQGNKTKVTDIKMARRGRMALRGEISSEGESKISGTLRVGLPDAMVVTSGNPVVDRMFGQVREGYRWIELDISGSGATPIDNFSDLYEAARLNANFNPESKESPDDSVIDSFEDLIDGN